MGTLTDRKGGKHKAERKTVQLDVDLHEALVTYTQSTGLKLKRVLKEFITKGIEHDITDDNWIEKLKKADRILDGFAHMGDCEGLAFGKDEKKEGVYSCVWFQEGRPPQIRILGKTESLMNGRCASCGKTKEIAMGFKERDTRIAELENKLGARSSQVWKVPKCNRGAIVNQDKEGQFSFKDCFRNTHEAVSVDRFCRVQSQGLPCMFFAELVVGVEGKA